jgi:dTMP kinase
MFITFEGGEGTGKSTQIRRLSEALTAAGHDVVTTREPGGTPEAEKIRSLLVNRDGGSWTPMAESLLLYAGRVMHVETLIKPAIALGKIVISDRFADSTRAYQAYGHGFPLETIETLNTLALDDFKPDLTFIFDMPVADGLARAGKRISATNSAEDRFERLGLEFHENMRQGYLEIAKREPERCVVINAARSIDEVAENLKNEVLKRLT